MAELQPRGYEGTIPIEETDKLREKCGVFAIWDPHSNGDLLEDTFAGVQAIQHRGEQGAGIATISPTHPGIPMVRGEGRVKQVFGPHGEGLSVLPNDATAAIGHTWYGIGASEGVQPIREELFALAHNGQLTNVYELAEMYSGFGIDVKDCKSDSDFVSKLLQEVAANFYDSDVEQAAEEVLPQLKGAFSLCILTPDKLIAARDGLRPLEIGTLLSGGYVLSSEVKSIDAIPFASWEREVKPGEVIIIDEFGLRNGPEVSANGPCAFEYIYGSNKHNIIGGIVVKQAREAFGERFAQRKGLPDVNVIVPIPNSAIPAGEGLAWALGKPDVRVLKRNPEYGEGEIDMPRSFLQPNDEARIIVANEKLIIDQELVWRIIGKSIAVVDDSMVRGHTIIQNVQKLREAGAAEVHAFITAPPYENTCEYGVDVGTLSELLAVQCDGDLDRMAEKLDVDSIHFLSLEDLESVIGKNCCTKCLGGKEPAGLMRKPQRELGSLSIGHRELVLNYHT